MGAAVVEAAVVEAAAGEAAAICAATVGIELAAWLLTLLSWTEAFLRRQLWLASL